MDRLAKLTIGSIGVLFIISLSIVTFWGYSINWAQWEEKREIWLPEKYTLTNKVGSDYLTVPRFTPSGSVNEISLEEYKRYFNEGSVTITADATIHYWTESLGEYGKTTYVASQSLTSSVDRDLKPVGIEILTDKEIQLRFSDSGSIFLVLFLAVAISGFGGLLLATGINKILSKRSYR